MTTPPAEYLTIAEAATELHAHAETVRRWIRAGRLHAVRPGRAYLVPRADLAALLATGATEEPEAAAAMIGLPRPTRGAPVHQVVLELSDPEFNCLRAMADRQGAESPAAAATDLVLRGLRAQWLAEQGAS